MKQRVMVPDYWKAFSCIAGKCEETCCAGWYIAIDEAAYKKYKKVKQPEMKKRLEKEIVVRKGTVSKDCVAKIKLKNNRCAFLAKDHLCDLYRNLGEEYLSETCRVYPRNINQVGEKLELSLALSCPEAARVILLQKEPLAFHEEEDTYHLPVVGGSLKISEGKIKHFEDAVLLIRKKLIKELQNRQKSWMERLDGVQKIFMELDGYKKKQDMKGLAAYLGQAQQEGGQRKSAALKLQEEPKDMKAFYEALNTMRLEKKWPSARYEACYELLMAGVGSQDQGQKEKWIWSEEKYLQGERQLMTEEAEKWTPILENYFVSYIYERLVPLDQNTPMESFEKLMCYFKLLKLHLVGILLAKGSLDQERMVTLIQSFTRVFDHNEQCMQQLKKLAEKSKA